MARDMLYERANEKGRLGLYDVRRHARERLNAIARTMGTSQAEALEVLLQAGESIMSRETAERYLIELQRKLCTPPGTRLKDCPNVEKLPPLPELSTPLGCGVTRTHVRLYDGSRQPVLSSDHPAAQIARERFARLAAEKAAREAADAVGSVGSEDEPG